MSTQELSQSNARQKVLSNCAKLDRLLRIMARWWDGWTWARIAQEHGISRQRVGRLLTQVGCTRALWCRAHRRRTGSMRRVLAGQAAQARDALLHRCAGRLTVRQRAALAWRALGLGSVDTARRMATTPTNVRGLLVAARWRLERLARPKRRKRARERVPRGRPEMSSPRGDEGIDIEWDGLVAGLTGTSRTSPKAPRTRRRELRGCATNQRHVAPRRARGVSGRRGGAVAREYVRSALAHAGERGPRRRNDAVEFHWSGLIAPRT